MRSDDGKEDHEGEMQVDGDTRRVGHFIFIVVLAGERTGAEFFIFIGFGGWRRRLGSLIV